MIELDGRVLQVVTDRLFHTTTAGASTMPLTSLVRVGRFRSSRATTQSEYTSFPPSDCPTNRDHLSLDRCQLLEGRPASRGGLQRPSCSVVRSAPVEQRKTALRKRWGTRNDGAPFRIEDILDHLPDWITAIETFQATDRWRAQDAERFLAIVVRLADPRRDALRASPPVFRVFTPTS